jgi:hypothetical protein
MFVEWMKSVMGHGQTSAVLPAGYAGLGADTIKAALYDNDITPDKDAQLTHTGYNASGSQWVASGNEVSDGTNWDAAGEPLTSKTLTDQGSGVFQFDAADTPQSGASCTLANVYGCLVYDDTITVGTGGIADQGISYHYFGGVQSVTAGTFTIVWHANGLFRVTMS